MQRLNLFICQAHARLNQAIRLSVDPYPNHTDRQTESNYDDQCHRRDIQGFASRKKENGT